MFKSCLVLALAVYASSAQDVQNLLNQIDAAAAPFANDINVTRADNAVSLGVGEYDWVLSENGEGEVELNVNSIPGNINNVASTLAGLLTTVGASAQENAGLINNIVSNEAQSLGVALQDNNVVAEAAEQYGSQLQQNAESITPALADAYNEVADQLSTNENGITDQVNHQINSGLANPNATVENLQSVLSNAYNNLPASTVSNLDNVANSVGTEAGNIALNLAQNIDPTESAAALERASSVNVHQVTNAINSAARSAHVATSATVNGVPTSVANAANTVAQSIANNGASSLGNVAVNIPTNINNGASNLGNVAANIPGFRGSGL